MMYTIVFHSGSVQHVTPAQRDAIVQDIENGKKHIMVDGCLIMLSSISRLEPSEKWIDSENERIYGTDDYICPYGSRETHGCNCARRGLLPLEEGEARQLIHLHYVVASLSEKELKNYKTYKPGAYEKYMSAITNKEYIDKVSERFPLALEKAKKQKLLEKSGKKA